MWILPNNHPLSSAFAQGYVESNEDLKEYFTQSEPPLLWKSKPLSWKTFLLQWKRVWWLRHLSGRILKPSTRSLFEESLTELLAATHASRSPWPETEEERTTQGTSGLSFDDTLRSYNRDGVFSRMLQDTLRSDSMSSSANWKKWVTGLRLESTQRRKSARLIAESDSSSLPSDSMWLTPRVMEVQESYETYLKRMQASPNPKNNTKTRPGNLSMQVHMGVNWPTPDCSDRRSAKSLQQGLSNKVKGWSTPRVGGMEGYQTRLARGKDAGLLGEVQMIEEKMNWRTPTVAEIKNQDYSTQIYLQNQVKSWPTTSTRDYKGGYEGGRIRNGKISLDTLDVAVQANSIGGLLDKEYISTNGESPARLNPAWSIQLMGTTLQRIFTVPLVIPLLSKQQNLPLETSSEKCTTGSDLLIDDWLNS